MIKEQPSDDKWACGWKKTKITLSHSTRAIIKIIVMSEAIMSHSGVLFLERAHVRARIDMYLEINERAAHTINYF